MDIFTYIKALFETEHSDDEKHQSVQPKKLTREIVAVLIYPGGMVDNLCIPTDDAQDVEQYIRRQLSENTMFHLGTRCQQGRFKGYEVWHDTSLYDRKDYNAKASHHFHMPLYGKVVIVNVGVDATHYDTFSPELINILSHALPPTPPEESCLQASKTKKRNRYTSPQPIVYDHNEPLHKDNNTTTNTLDDNTRNTSPELSKKKAKKEKKPPKATRRSSRIAARKTRFA